MYIFINISDCSCLPWMMKVIGGRAKWQWLPKAQLYLLLQACSKELAKSYCLAIILLKIKLSYLILQASYKELLNLIVS